MDTATTSKSPSSGGLWKRQSSLASGDETSSVAAGDPAELELSSGGSGDIVPLLSSASLSPMDTTNAATASNNSSSVDNPKIMWMHVALSLAFMMVGTSIVPIFASAEDEAWRTQHIPYQTTAAGDVMLDLQLNHPLVDPPTISSRLLIFTAVGVPFLFLVAFHFYTFWDEFQNNNNNRQQRSLGRLQRHHLRASLCALFVSVGLSESVTCTLKLYVSRHRPNFYALCGFDVATKKCLAVPLRRVHEAALSFPSGHSSLSFCGMTLVAYFLLGRLALLTPASSISVGNNKGLHIQLWPHKSLLGVLACVVPLCWAFFVASSRIVDKWHHPSDVIAGTILGVVAATLGYHAFYPSTLSPFFKAGIPLSLQPQQQIPPFQTQQSNSNPSVV